MQARQLSTIAVGIWAVWAVASPLFAAHQDAVRLKTPRGERIERGTIREESIQRFRMVDGRGQPMPDFTGEQIISIEWDIQDFDYMRAKGAYEKGQYASAAESFKACVDNPNMRKAVQAYLAYMCGDSYRRASKPTEAEAVLEKMIERFPQSWYIPEAIDKLVDACATSGNYKKMTPLLRKLRELPGDKYKAKATMYEGRMLKQTKKIDEAMRKFTEAANATSDPEARGQARMMLADCYVLKKEYDNAKQTAEKAITQDAPAGVLGYAHLVIGNTYYQQAMDKKGDAAKDLYLDAVLEYLRVWTLYPGSDAVEGEALYRAGESFKYLSKLPGRRSDRRRAAEMFAQVSRKFPGSYWAKQAEKAMKEIR